MNEITFETLDILDGVHKMLIQQRANAAKHGDKDKYGYEFEYSDSFGTDALNFQETAMMLEIEANETFRIMREINRHSPLYFQMCTQLEKLISQLGSVCITKAVKEQQEGDTFKMLEKLTVSRLREMTAFNFRKCYQSFIESQTVLVYNANALGFSIRWSALDKRLLATEEKIEKIKSGKLKIDISSPQDNLTDQLKDQAEAAADASVPGEGAQGSGQKAAPEAEKKQAAHTAFASKGRAFSVDKSSFGNADVRISNAGAASEEVQTDLSKVQTEAEAVPEAVNDQPEQAADRSEQLPAAAEMEENEETAGISGADDALPETGNEDLSFEDTDEYPDVDSAEYAYEDTDEEENLPFVSEDLVRRMSAYCNSPEFLQQMTWPALEYAKLPP